MLSFMALRRSRIISIVLFLTFVISALAQLTHQHDSIRSLSTDSDCAICFSLSQVADPPPENPALDLISEVLLIEPHCVQEPDRQIILRPNSRGPPLA